MNLTPEQQPTVGTAPKEFDYFESWATKEGLINVPFGGTAVIPTVSTVQRAWKASGSRLATTLSQLQARADWLQKMHTLHRAVEMLYVVDGYQVTLTWDGNPISPGFHGETLEEAIDKAMAGFDAEAKPQFHSSGECRP